MDKDVNELTGSYLNSVIDDTFFVVCKSKSTSRSYVGKVWFVIQGFNKQDSDKKLVSLFIVC